MESNPTQRIYQVMASIPEGALLSYGQVAELAGLPGRARLVGRVLSQLPPDTRLPWHRVVGANGRISFPADSTGYQRQLSRLITEGSAMPDGSLRWRDRRLK